MDEAGFEELKKGLAKRPIGIIALVMEVTS